jgi:hypothetical protein
MQLFGRIVAEVEPEIKQMFLELCHEDDRNQRQMVSYLIKQEYRRRKQA